MHNKCFSIILSKKSSVHISSYLRFAISTPDKPSDPAIWLLDSKYATKHRTMAI